MAYRYPKNVAEMANMRSGQLAALPHPANRLPAERPKCKTHGYMTLRPAGRQTYEQLFCGTWYDCEHCGGSSLLASRDLCHQTGEPFFDGTVWHQHDGEQWQPISDADADAFWQAKADSWAAREAAQRKPQRRRRSA